MPLLGQPDFARPIPFASGQIYYPYGGGPFVLAPSRCVVRRSNAGTVDFQLDLVRALDDRESRATLICTLDAEYPTDDALARVRDDNAHATLAPCVLTEWWFRVLPSAVLGAPVELATPTSIASNGLGSARVMASLDMATGLLLESMLTTRAPLDAVAEATIEGVVPRAPVVVRFESSALLDRVLARADSCGVLPRREILDLFSRDIPGLPLSIDGALDPVSIRHFAEAMTDRIVAKFGRYVPSQAMADAPVVQFDPDAENASLVWALSQPAVAKRRVVLPVSLLAAAQMQVERNGLESVVRRTTLTSLPSLGAIRVTVLCNVPASRAGVDALGVTLTFPPHRPYRPQAQTVTGVFDATTDIAVLEARLSPGESADYQYSAFAVLTDELGTRQIDAPPRSGEGSPLHLSTEDFPIDFATIEVAAPLAQLAVVSGVCAYEHDGVRHEQKFLLDSGNLAASFAVPRDRSWLKVDGYAVGRDGSGQLPIGPLESLAVRLDLTSFSGYGPQQIDVTCVFDDSATLRAITLLPADREESPENVTTLSFTPAEPARTFRWSARSPFASGVRYRAFNSAGPWTDVPAGRGLVLYSSDFRKQERHRVRLEAAEAGPAAPESAVDAVGVSASYEVTDNVLYERIDDASKKLFIPRYALDSQTVSGQDRYRLSMSQQNATSTLEVNLVSAPAASIAEQARDAEAYPHRVTVQLDFLVAPESGARKSLEFTEITRNANFAKAVLTFDTLAERDDVYRALTEQDRDARLTVQRHLDIRVPERPAPGGGGGHGHGGGGGFGGGGGGSLTPGHLPIMALPLRPIQVLRPKVPIPDPPPIVTPVTAVLTATTPEPVVLPGVALKPRISAIMLSPRSRIEAASATLREINPALVARPRIADDVVLRRVGTFVPTLPTPQLSFAGREESGGFTRCLLSVTNWAEFSDDFFAASGDLPPCGLNKNASRTWVDIIDADTGARLYGFCALGAAKQLTELWFGVPAGTTVPAHVAVTLTDRRTKIARRSNAVDTSAPERSAPTTRDIRMQLEQVVLPSPFAFAPALYGYVFQGITPGSGSNASQLIRYRFSWKGTFHTYLQDASRPKVVYVFADEFKIARRPDTPFSPFATVRVASRPDASDTDVVFDYVVAPYIAAKRLDDAKARLLADPRFGADTVEFQPFLTTDVRFFIDRPSMGGAVREQRPDAAVVLQSALKDTLTMPLGDFRLLFDAMHRRTASLFLGRVEIDVPGSSTETIPFSARMDDLAGELFTYELAIDADGLMHVTARNETESPLSVQAIDATVTWNGTRARGLVQGSAIPTASLAPGATIQFTVAPEAPLPANADPDLSFDLSGVTAIPDPEAIWDSILDRTTVEYFRLVTVKTVATLFEPVLGSQQAAIVSILVEFEGGGTAELNAAALEAKVRVDYPIDDVVLGRAVSTTYRYTVTVIRADGKQERDTAPREGSSATFFVNVMR